MMSWSSSEVTLPLGLQPLEWLLLEARAVRAGAPGPAGEHWGFRDPETGGRPTALSTAIPCGLAGRGRMDGRDRQQTVAAVALQDHRPV